MIEIIAALLLLAFMVLIITALVFGFARGVIWWQSRRSLPVADSEPPPWDPSEREGPRRSA